MIKNFDITFQLLFLATPFALGLTGLAMDLRIAGSKEYNVMIGALQRSACLPFIVTLWGEKTLRARMLVTFMVAGIIKYPKSSIRRGMLDAQDYEQFPSSMKKRIVISSWLNTVAFSWLIIGSYFL
ncbi:hypothetical protein IRZ53_10605 [Pseudomonas fulva]|uniref:hypothetical protein n=1 Tax=Pseudomonas fulva TaxID=47880 RepID=UPI0018AA72BD|nr:hypothetical protein [Pseudomonas fulva]MBF8675135.1 hypothetical protein [Pseudomonas fulva]MBF8697241.1 hypothetical protein [Pseudomonas fulva]